MTMDLVVIKLPQRDAGPKAGDGLRVVPHPHAGACPQREDRAAHDDEIC